jgi:putative aldouronate transport system substrate-binding protein
MYIQDPASVPEDQFVIASTFYVAYFRAMGLREAMIKDDVLHREYPVFFGTTETMKLKWSNLRDLEEQAFIKIITGVEPLDYFDTFVSEWKNLGGDEIIAEIASMVQGN